MKKNILQKVAMYSLAIILSLSLYSCKGVSDTDIKADISEKLSASAGMSNVTVDVKDGVVTTRGEVPDESSRTQVESTIKTVKGVKSVVNNTAVKVAEAAPAPVEISTDDALSRGVTDAIKDYEGVKADVNDGVITLTGNIKRARLQNLMMSLNTLKPKKIENQLTIK